MKLKRSAGIIAILLILLLSACGAAELPEPQALLDEIRERVALPEFTLLPGDYLEDYTGIAQDDYESAVYCLRSEGLSPDEIAILRAKDSAAAAEIEAKLRGNICGRKPTSCAMTGMCSACSLTITATSAAHTAASSPAPSASTPRAGAW